MRELVENLPVAPDTQSLVASVSAIAGAVALIVRAIEKHFERKRRRERDKMKNGAGSAADSGQ
jgi:hypothetical protein